MRENHEMFMVHDIDFKEITIHTPDLGFMKEFWCRNDNSIYTLKCLMVHLI